MKVLNHFNLFFGFKSPSSHSPFCIRHAYLDSTGIRGDAKGPVFRSLALGPGRPLSKRPLAQSEAWRMICRRAKDAGIKTKLGCHTFRATGSTAYLENGGTLEHAQQVSGTLSSSHPESALA